MEVDVQLYLLIQAQVGLLIDVYVRRVSTANNAIQVNITIHFIFSIEEIHSIYISSSIIETSSCATLSCPSYQVCSEQPTGPICGCPSNKVGTLCQYGTIVTYSISWRHIEEMFYYIFQISIENPCYHGPECRNGGTCVPSNTDPPIRSCICPEGWIGPNCEHKKINDPCASNPCQTRGHCALSKSNRTYVCLCHDQFLGDQCERGKHF